MVGLVATATWSRASVAELDSLQTGSQRVSKPLVAVQATDPRIRGVLGEKISGEQREETVSRTSDHCLRWGRSDDLSDACVRLAGESVLEVSRDGKAKECEGVARPRYGFQFIPDIAVLGIEGEKEALFAFFDVERGCDIEEAEAGRRVYDFNNAAQIQ